MILIAGCGYLGSYLIDALRERTDEPIVAAALHPRRADPARGLTWEALDVADPASVKALSDRYAEKVTTVFYLAACHNIDFIVKEPLAAANVNLAGLERFMRAFWNVQKLLFASTDCVYGENTPEKPAFTEDDPLDPVNLYGRQKAGAETLVRAMGYTAVRFGYMLGESKNEKPHFYDRLCASLRRGEPIEMIDGMRRSTLSYAQAAEALARLGELPAGSLPGAVNAGGDEGLTKYEMGLRVAQRVGADPALVRPITMDEGKKFFTDARANSAVMDSSLLKKLTGMEKINF